MTEMPAGLGVIGWFSLAFAPGAWITFGIPLAIPFWARLFTGVMLSPLAVLVQFCALRLAGVSFATTAVLLAVLNIPAFLLIWRAARPLQWPDRGGWIVALSAVAISVVSMAEVLFYFDARVYSPHAWVYADPIYMLARGDLVLDDPNVAGIRLAYPPWPGLVLQGLQSYLLNSPPISSFVWWNLLTLILIYGFAAGIARQLGGGALAQCTAGIWLLFGSNLIGYWAGILVPGLRKYNIYGDPRYTPWADKFRLFSTMPIGLGCVAALLYLLMRRAALTRGVLITTALLLTATGLLYPLLFPPACAIVAAKAIALFFERRAEKPRALSKDWLALGTVMVFAALATYAELHFLTTDRGSTTAAVLLSRNTAMLRKVIAFVIVTAPMLAGLAYVLRRRLRSQPGAVLFLIAGALGGGALHALLDIPFWANEYKFMFAVFLCLGVFPALAMERIWETWRRPAAIAALTIIGVLLLGTHWRQTATHWRHTAGVETSTLDTSGFRVKLRNGAPWWDVCAAVSRLTPSNAVLVVDSSDVYFPLFSGRNQYVPAREQAYHGITLSLDTLTADHRGNGRAIIHQRRAILRELFDATDPDRRQLALDQMLGLNRPLALIVETRHDALHGWIEARRPGTKLHGGNAWTLWLIAEPSQPPQSKTMR